MGHKRQLARMKSRKERAAKRHKRALMHHRERVIKRGKLSGEQRLKLGRNEKLHKKRLRYVERAQKGTTAQTKKWNKIVEVRAKRHAARMKARKERATKRHEKAMKRHKERMKKLAAYTKLRKAFLKNEKVNKAK